MLDILAIWVCIYIYIYIHIHVHICIYGIWVHEFDVWNRGALSRLRMASAPRKSGASLCDVLCCFFRPPVMAMLANFEKHEEVWKITIYHRQIIYNRSNYMVSSGNWQKTMERSTISTGKTHEISLAHFPWLFWHNQRVTQHEFPPFIVIYTILCLCPQKCCHLSLDKLHGFLDVVGELPMAAAFLLRSNIPLYSQVRFG